MTDFYPNMDDMVDNDLDDGYYDEEDDEKVFGDENDYRGDPDLGGKSPLEVLDELTSSTQVNDLHNAKDGNPLDDSMEVEVQGPSGNAPRSPSNLLDGITDDELDALGNGDPLNPLDDGDDDMFNEMIFGGADVGVEQSSLAVDEQPETVFTAAETQAEAASAATETQNETASSAAEVQPEAASAVAQLEPSDNSALEGNQSLEVAAAPEASSQDDHAAVVTDATSSSDDELTEDGGVSTDDDSDVDGRRESFEFYSPRSVSPPAGPPDLDTPPQLSLTAHHAPAQDHSDKDDESNMTYAAQQANTQRKVDNNRGMSDGGDAVNSSVARQSRLSQYSATQAATSATNSPLRPQRYVTERSRSAQSPVSFSQSDESEFSGASDVPYAYSSGGSSWQHRGTSDAAADATPPRSRTPQKSTTPSAEQSRGRSSNPYLNRKRRNYQGATARSPKSELDDILAELSEDNGPVEQETEEAKQSFDLPGWPESSVPPQTSGGNKSQLQTPEQQSTLQESKPPNTHTFGSSNSSGKDYYAQELRIGRLMQETLHLKALTVELQSNLVEAQTKNITILRNCATNHPPSFFSKARQRKAQLKETVLRCKKLTQENKRIARALEQRSQAYAKLSKNARALTDEVEDLRAACQEHESQNEILAAELEEMKARFAQLSNLVQEKIDTIGQKENMLENYNDKVHKLGQQSQRWRQKLVECEKALSDQIRLVGEKQMEVENLQNDLSAKKLEYKATVTEKNTEVSKLSSQLLEASKVSKQLGAQITSLKEEKQYWQDKWENSQESGLSMQEQCQVYQAERDSFKVELESKTGLLQQLGEKHRALQREHSSLRQSLSQAKQMSGMQVAEAKRRLKEQTDNMEMQAEEKRIKHQNAIKKLKREHDKEREALTAVVTKCRSVIPKLMEKNKKLSTELSQERGRSSAAQRDAQQKKHKILTELSQLRTKHRQLRLKYRDLCAAQTIQNARHAKERSQLQRSGERARPRDKPSIDATTNAKIKKLVTAFQKLQRENAQLKTQVAAKKTTSRQSRSPPRMLPLESSPDIGELNSLIASTSSRMDVTSKRRDELKKQLAATSSPRSKAPVRKSSSPYQRASATVSSSRGANKQRSSGSTAPRQTDSPVPNEPVSEEKRKSGGSVLSNFFARHVSPPRKNRSSSVDVLVDEIVPTGSGESMQSPRTLTGKRNPEEDDVLSMINDDLLDMFE